ncbi:hypothetical protein BOTBODRAFT_170217 [Botryobasidium botryosum FD-172 SS1]|uniref:Uncharacterized protein n=1 Tax=Botryobasidium botryosum (strain FD-172 SS1) TaxID=930990 RepID=A0A067N8V8_BOTB1|nr:hypothetical protein BOTBODRAFT_170217 [Botryobasidium botryosum FD-172 SS1]
MTSPYQPFYEDGGDTHSTAIQPHTDQDMHRYESPTYAPSETQTLLASTPSFPREINAFHAGPPLSAPHPAETLQASYTQRRLGFSGLFPTLAVILLTAGSGTILILWLAIHQVPGRSVLADGAFTVDEGQEEKEGLKSASMRGLTISSYIGNLVGMAGPFVMTLYGLRAAAQWLWAERTGGASMPKPDSPPLAPTPLQYGLLTRLIGSSGFMSLYETGRYLWRSPRARSPAPRFFIETFTVALFIFSITQIITLADLWLHSAAYATLLPLEAPWKNATNFSVEFNQTKCDLWPDPIGDGKPCFAISDTDTWGDFPLRQAGYATVTNSSSPEGLQVITLQEAGDAAVIVPASIPPDLSFNASTTGARASCTSINQKCDRDRGGTYPTAQVQNCSSAGYPQLPYYPVGADRNTTRIMTSHVYGLMGNMTVGELYGNYEHSEHGATPQNPSTILLQLSWVTPGSYGTDDINNIIEIVPSACVTIYAACSLAIFNGTLEYTTNATTATGSYKLIYETPSSGRYYGILWGPLLWQSISPRLALNIEGLAMTSNSPDAIMARVNQELTRLMLGSAAGVFQRVEATNVAHRPSTLVGVYPLPALLTYVSLLYIFAAIALFVFATSAVSSSYVITVPASLTRKKEPMELSSLELAEAWLTNPLTLVSALFPSNEHQHPDYNDKFSVTGTTESLNMFVDTPETEKVMIGLGPPESSQPRYGVWQRKVPLHGEKLDEYESAGVAEAP